MFDDGKKEHGTSYKKSLIRSIRYAEKIKKGEMTIEQVNERVNSSDTESDIDSMISEIKKNKNKESKHNSNNTESSEDSNSELDQEDDSLNSEDDSKVKGDRTENEIEQEKENCIKNKKRKLDELIESLIFIKVNTPGNSNCKTLFTKLSEIEDLVNDLLFQKGIYQVS